MKFAIIDTETNGLHDFSKPADASGQPRLASIAILLADINWKGLDPSQELAEAGVKSSTELRLTCYQEENFLIRPDGWEMKPEATQINGLTTEHLIKNGVPVMDALDYYSRLIRDGFIVTAFNAQFDTKVMRGELRLAGMPDLFEVTPNVCLMRACTNVCRVPKANGKGYKFPKLSEACAFFKIEQPAAHSALGDARSAFAILQHLHKANLVPAAEIHFAKEKPAAVPAAPTT